MAGAFAAAVAAVTWLFLDSRLFVETLGFAALLLEANLASPQLLANFARRSTQGMSLGMVGAWFVGDVAKTGYFIARRTPLQFPVCGALQVTLPPPPPLLLA